MTCFQLFLEAVRVSQFKKKDSCSCCVAFKRLSCVRSAFVLTNKENKEGREPRTVRRRGSAERAPLGRATECTRTHNFDDFSSTSPFICRSPQLSNISSMSSCCCDDAQQVVEAVWTRIGHCLPTMTVALIDPIFRSSKQA